MLMLKFKIFLFCSYGFVINTYQKHMTLKRVTCPNMDKSEIHAARAGKCTSYVTSHPNKDIFKQKKQKTKKPTSESALKRFNVTSFCTYAIIDTNFFVTQKFESKVLYCCTCFMTCRRFSSGDYALLLSLPIETGFFVEAANRE